jgi:hypothetical protein
MIASAETPTKPSFRRAFSFATNFFMIVPSSLAKLDSPSKWLVPDQSAQAEQSEILGRVVSICPALVNRCQGGKALKMADFQRFGAQLPQPYLQLFRL